MIAAIFALHFIAAGYAFVVRKKDGGLAEGLLAVAFFAVIFSVGWTLLTALTGFVVPQEGLAPWLNRDATTLVLLTFAEGIFYFYYLRGETRGNKEKKTGEGPTSV